MMRAVECLAAILVFAAAFLLQEAAALRLGDQRAGGDVKPAPTAAVSGQIVSEGYAKSRLKNWVPLVGPEVYDPRPAKPGKTNGCCMQDCACKGRKLCCLKSLMKTPKMVAHG